MPDIVNVLHLSDLHFGMEETEKVPSTAVDQRNLTLRELIKTLKKIDKDWQPHVVAISGDIGWKGIKEDYDKAREWLTNDLLPIWKLSPDKLVVCPGNHDIDRDEAFVMMDPPSSYDKADETLKLERNKKFSRPFEEFVAFCIEMGLSPLEIGIQSHYLTGKIDLPGLRFVILNSAWFCRGGEDFGKLWLGKPLLETMAAKFQLIDPDNYDVPDSPITLALCHHPHEWLNEVEYNTFGNRQSTLEYLSLRSHIILTGHVHARHAEPGRPFNRAWLVKGGTCYAGATYLNHFSILKIDIKNRTFQRLAYEFDPGKNQWRKDGEDKNPPCYGLKMSTTPTASPQLIIPGKYREWVNAQCKDMDITKLAETTSVIQVRLPEIYIPLYANPLKKSDEKQGPVDVEDLIVEERIIVIEGRAGSGKTTQAKHFTYMMIQTPGWKGFDGYLPVLVFLKDLKGFDPAGVTGNSDTAEKLLMYWAKNTDSFLDVDVIRGFCEAGKAIFFLDGLDEIHEPLREMIVTSFLGLGIKYEKCKIILSGRPHGVDAMVKKCFGRPVEVLPLLMNQVEAFIHKWFQVIFESDCCGFNKTAPDLIGEVKSHPSIGELIDSPLMLTAICLLYNDNKELPGQRAELYDRFVTNLLFKRFREEAQKVRNFLMDLASEMHIRKRSKTIDRLDAIHILKNEYKQIEGESQEEYNQRLNEKFDVLEPGCGLLKSEKSGYGFIHLTFQEFFTANALVAGTTERHFDAIRIFWDDDWHREVVQLYIGHMSIQSPAMANNIIQRILEEKEGRPFAGRRLAVRAFIDIHRDKRDYAVTRSSISCLWEIIESNAEPPVKAEAGELLGRLGDKRDVEEFIPILDGEYETSTGTVELKNFQMAKYPVTNRWFRKFIEADGYKKPELWSSEGKKWLKKEKAGNPKYWFDHKWNCDNHPVVGVSWYEADAFCRWLTQTRQDGFTYRLPDEKEWEAAAVGEQRRKYPWGKEFDYTRCNTDESRIGKTSAVGIFKEGDTPDGLSDLSGNVWDWTCTNREKMKSQPDFKDSEWPALRGGSWLGGSGFARCDNRDNILPINRYFYVGFRCSRTK